MSEPRAYAKPLPDITPESRPFWEGTRRHVLLIQRCRACGAVQHYPRGVCAACWAADPEWIPSAGRGRIYTFTVTYRTQARGFRDELPYVLGGDPARLAIGMPVRVVFEAVTPEISLPRFTPAG
jgi:hypothetical protein